MHWIAALSIGVFVVKSKLYITKRRISVKAESLFSSNIQTMFLIVLRKVNLFLLYRETSRKWIIESEPQPKELDKYARLLLNWVELFILSLIPMFSFITYFKNILRGWFWYSLFLFQVIYNTSDTLKFIKYSLALTCILR